MTQKELSKLWSKHEYYKRRGSYDTYSITQDGKKIKELTAVLSAHAEAEAYKWLMDHPEITGSVSLHYYNHLSYISCSWPLMAINQHGIN